MNQALIKQLKGLPFSSYVFQLTVIDDPLLPRTTCPFIQLINKKRFEAVL